MSLGTTVKTIQDIMRKDAGVDGDAQRISQLVWMIFLKVLDDREREREALEDGFKSPIPRELRWRTWAADPAGMTGEGLLQFVDGSCSRGSRRCRPWGATRRSRSSSAGCSRTPTTT
jgi:type I restriction enzyme M protein